MKTSVKHVSDTNVELTIQLDKTELKEAEQVALVRLARDMKVAGFRKGKVPASVAAKHVDPNQLAEQTLERALSKAVADAFTKEDLQALDRPEVEVKKFVPGSELEFVATCDVLPPVTLGDYKTLTSKPETVKVTASEVNEVIDRIRSAYATKNEVKRAAQKGDEVVIDFVGTKDGVAFDGGASKDYALTLGSNTFIPGFEDGVIGKKPGEEFTIDVTFPQDYHAAELKGAPVQFAVTLKKVNEVTEPELSDELAAKAGPFKTVAELKADIKKEITAQKQREASEKHKDALVSELVEKSTVPVPAVLLKDQIASIERDLTQNLMYRGLTLDSYLAQQGFKDKADWTKREATPAAEKRVKAGLVLAELSKQEKIEASQEELLERMNALGSQYPNEELRKQLKTPEAQRDVANRLLTDKTVERLVELNTK